MSNSTKITEDLFEAIQKITNASISNLKYDKTQLCTIIKKINQYRYTVQDGYMQFEAIYDGEDEFKEGDSVYVTIPNGDYEEPFKKIIGNKARTEQTNITQYKSPLQSMVDFVNFDVIPSAAPVTEFAVARQKDLNDPSIELETSEYEFKDQIHYFKLSGLEEFTLTAGKDYVFRFPYISIDYSNHPCFTSLTIGNKIFLTKQQIRESDKCIELTISITETFSNISTINLIGINPENIEFNVDKNVKYSVFSKYNISNYTWYNQPGNFKNLGLSFKVKTNLNNNSDIIEYGLAILCYDAANNLDQTVYVSSNHFLGNPFNYFTFQTQEEVFSLNVAGFDVIPYYKKKSEENLTFSENSDIIIKEIKGYLGYPQTDFNDEEDNLHILSSGSLDYKFIEPSDNVNPNSYNLHAVWIRKNENNGIWYRETEIPTEDDIPYHSELEDYEKKTVLYEYKWTTYNATPDIPDDDPWNTNANAEYNTGWFIRNQATPLDIKFYFPYRYDKYQVRLQIIKTIKSIKGADEVISKFDADLQELVKNYSLDNIEEADFIFEKEALIAQVKSDLNLMSTQQGYDIKTEELGTKIIEFTLTAKNTEEIIFNDDINITLDDSQYNGKYYIYSKAAATTTIGTKYLNAKYYSGKDFNDENYQEIIVWYIPKLDTMLKPPEEYLNDIWQPDETDSDIYLYETYETKETIPKGDEWSLVDSNDQVFYKEGYYGIKSSTLHEARCPIQFKTKYDPGRTNNTVLCIDYVIKNSENIATIEREYSAFEFGYSEQQNTKYALTIVPVDQPYVLAFAKEDVQVPLTLKAIVTFQGTIVDSSTLQFKWSEVKNYATANYYKEKRLLQYTRDFNNNIVEIKAPSIEDIKNYNDQDKSYDKYNNATESATWLRDIFSAKYIECSVNIIESSSQRTVTLKQTYPIATFYTDNYVKLKDEKILGYYITPEDKDLYTINDIAGSTSIVYNSSGSNPSYVTDYYEIYNDAGIPYINIDIEGYIDYEEQVNNRLWSRIPCYGTGTIIPYAYANTNVFINDSKNSKKENLTLTTVLGFQSSKTPIDGTLTVDFNKLSLHPTTQYIENQYYTIFLELEKYGYWYQPILIEKETYINPALIGWDGKTDVADNYILSSMVGAGKMESGSNSFTGVFMGEVQRDSKIGNGLFGYKNGSEIFRLTTDGEIFIGKEDSDGDNAYLRFDADESLLDIQAKYFHVGNSNGFLEGDSSGTIKIKAHNFELSDKDSNLIIDSSKSNKITIKNGTIALYGKTDATLTTWNEFKSYIPTQNFQYFADKSSPASCLNTFQGQIIQTEKKYWENKTFTSNTNTTKEIKYTDILSTYPIFRFGISTNIDVAEQIDTGYIKTNSLYSVLENYCAFNSKAYENITGNTFCIGVRGQPIAITDTSISTETTIVDSTDIPSNTLILYSACGDSFSANDDTAYILLKTLGVQTSTKEWNQASAILIKANDDLCLNSKNGRLTGSWIGTSSISITSDINKKNTINSISTNYSILFDNLQPVTYKYNDGTSDRLHTGFIAQQVKESLDKANISTQNFAGLVIKNQGAENEEWCLRYEEFVALNTNEIQKLKKRVNQLESEVSSLKEQLLNIN